MSECGFEIPAGALASDEDRAGRVMACTRCQAAVRVYEASLHAENASEHLFLDAATFTCGGCLEDAADPSQALRRMLDAQRGEVAV